VSETEDATLSTSDRATFGQNFSVSISGNTIAAGAPFESVNGSGQQGMVFLFNKGPGGWTSGTQTGTVVASDGGSCDHLGWSTSLSDGQLAASNQTGNCHSSNGPGAVYVFGSVPTTSIALSPVAPNGRNGWYVSPVDVVVSAVDDAGVATTRCALDPPSPPKSFAAIPAACPFAGDGSAVGGDGQHTVYAASLGALGTTEPPTSATFKIDTSPPTVTCSPPPSFTLRGSGGLVAAEVSDAISGAAQATVAAPANVSTAGHERVTLTGFDNAGNSATVQCPYVVLTPRINARLNWTATQFSAFTILTELIISHAPSGAQIAIRCEGGGCRFKHHTVHIATIRLVCNRHHKRCKRAPAPPLSTVDILSPLRGRHLAVGTKVTVTVTMPQTVGEVWTLRIRPARAPVETGPTCLAPGSTKPGRGC
jgi:hypothetical protein